MTDIFDEIAALKVRENATILAHYYQDGEIQQLADFTGDSLKLSRAATAFRSTVSRNISPGPYGIAKPTWPTISGPARKIAGRDTAFPSPAVIRYVCSHARRHWRPCREWIMGRRKRSERRTNGRATRRGRSLVGEKDRRFADAR